MLISNLPQDIIDVAADLKITPVLIGGLALPAYNVARTTLDIDICINVESQEKLNQFIKILSKKGISTVQNPKISHKVFTVFSKQGEAEIWLSPCDAFVWDDEMVNKVKKFHSNVYVLAIEDFIITKLARADRSATDIDDILQILIANKSRIDWEYLRFRLKWASVENEFKEILKVFELDVESNYKTISKEILDKYKNLYKH